MKMIRSLPEFAESFNFDETEKKVMIVTVDGGPGENPRYQKTIASAIEYFEEYQLDALFLATNAPGRSVFNRTERRMAPLSREMSGLILPHETFGSHLDGNGKTIDDALELKNFEHAGKVLAEVWSNMSIDGHPVVAEFISDEANEPVVSKSEKWKAIHVRESQYLLQIVKCNDRKCCLPFESDYLIVLNDRFLPPLLPLQNSKTDGLVWASDDKDGTYLSLFQNIDLKENLKSKRASDTYPKGLPYDFSCPSVDARP